MTILNGLHEIAPLLADRRSGVKEKEIDPYKHRNSCAKRRPVGEMEIDKAEADGIGRQV